VDDHANAGRILEGLVAQAEGRGVGDGVESHAAGPCEHAVEEDRSVGQMSIRAAWPAEHERVC
jgi:hypothetical protein